MRNIRLLLVLSALSLLASACGLAPADPPPPSATLGTPKATALSELPPTWTPAPTATLLPTKTPRPTATPTQDPNNYRIDLVMPAEIAPYPDQFVDRTGWIMLEGKTAAVSLPPSFVALDIVSPLMEMMQGMVEAFAEGFTDFAESLGDELGTTPETTPEPIDLGELPAFDFLIALEESSQSTMLLVSAGRGPETTTEDVLNEGLSNLESEFLVTSWERYNGAPLPMERVILSIEKEELGRGVQVVYAILGPDAAWNLIFATSADLADYYLPIFESAADSFVPQP